MKINDPGVLAEVEVAFAAYEDALLKNDNETLLAYFLDDPTTTRYGVADVQHGFDEIADFRTRQLPFDRKLVATVIATYGHDHAVASTQFLRDELPGQIGRQTQVWVRTEDGWKVAAAHVSMIAAPA
jgi:ketosteroid isomerase-like protein